MMTGRMPRAKRLTGTACRRAGWWGHRLLYAPQRNYVPVTRISVIQLLSHLRFPRRCTSIRPNFASSWLGVVAIQLQQSRGSYTICCLMRQLGAASWAFRSIPGMEVVHEKSSRFDWGYVAVCRPGARGRFG